MNADTFDALGLSLWESVPPHFKEKIDNVALLFEDEPSEEVCMQEGLEKGETLLGLYHGIPLTHRGQGYGVGMTLPDTITIYRSSVLESARYDMRHTSESLEEAVERVLAETLWHEVGHYFGLSDREMHEREVEGTNVFKNENADLE